MLPKRLNVAILGIKKLPATAGADRVVEQLLDNLGSEHNYYVYLQKINNRLASPPIKENIQYIYIPSIKGKHLNAFIYFFFCSVHYILINLVKRKYDVAHIHNSDFGLFCIFLRVVPKIRIIGTFHGDPYKRQKWGRFAKIYLKGSEFFFVRFCNYLTSVAKSKNVGVKKEVYYIPNGINVINVFNNNDETFDYDKWEIKKGQYFLFACGRVDATKGLHHLIKAYESSKYQDKLLVIGDFNHDESYSRYIQSTPNGNIIFHKRLLSKKLLLDVLNNCKLFIFPSEYEAMSMMLLEALSCQKVVVCSNIEENIEIVGEDYPYLFVTKDSEDLKTRINMALDDIKKNKLLKPSFYNNIIDCFNWQTISKQYISLYETVTSK